ncbi:MAG: hypothetical protein KAT05_11025 [Spirochaetes bacterium]|nr:hypothetical protein [Spirochaetota bacterium]
MTNFRRVLIIVIVIFTISVVFFIGCVAPDAGGSEKESEDDSGLPDTYKIDVPGSLQEGAKTKGGGDLSEDSLGSNMIKNMIKEMDQNGSKISMLFVMIDTLIKNIEPDAKTDWYTDKQIVFTQDMYNKVVEMDGSPPPDVEVNEIKTAPKFKYLTNSNFPSIKTDTSGYNRMVIICEEFPPGPSGIPTLYQYILWNEPDDGKVKVFMEHDRKNPPDIVRIEYTYDDNAKKASMFYGWEAPPLEWDNTSEQWQIIMNTEDRDVDAHGITMEQKDSANNGVMIDFFQKKKRVEGMGIDSKYIIFDFFVNGYADDNGGYMESTFIDKNFKDKTGDEIVGFADAKTYKYKEKFDGNGNIIAAMYFDPNSGLWVSDTNLGGEWSDPDQKDKYDTGNNEGFEGDDPEEFDKYFGENDTVIKVRMPLPGIGANQLTWGTYKEKRLSISSQNLTTGQEINAGNWNYILGFFILFNDEHYTDLSDDFVVHFFLRDVVDKTAIPDPLYLLDVSNDGITVNKSYTLTSGDIYFVL